MAAPPGWFHGALRALEGHGRFPSDPAPWRELVRSAVPAIRRSPARVEDLAQALQEHLCALRAGRPATWRGLSRCPEAQLRAQLRRVALWLYRGSEERAAERHALGQLVRKALADRLPSVEAAPATLRDGTRFSLPLVREAVAWVIGTGLAPAAPPQVLTQLMSMYEEELGGVPGPAEADDDPETQARRRVDGMALARRLDGALSGEPELYDVLCRSWSGESCAEIAKELGCSAATAHARLQAAYRLVARVARPAPARARPDPDSSRYSNGTLRAGLEAFRRIAARRPRDGSSGQARRTPPRSRPRPE